MTGNNIQISDNVTALDTDSCNYKLCMFFFCDWYSLSANWCFWTWKGVCGWAVWWLCYVHFSLFGLLLSAGMKDAILKKAFEFDNQLIKREMVVQSMYAFRNEHHGMIWARHTHNNLRNFSSEIERENLICCFHCYKDFEVGIGCNYLRTDPTAVCMLMWCEIAF